MEGREGALAGLKVVEFAQLVAGPIAGSLLADLGAEVVHVEDPRHGDPHRRSGHNKDGKGLWWKVSGRNKRSVTLDLRQAEGQALAARLAAWADVVITNFRVGTIEKWSLDYKSLQAHNPKLVYLQISGFGAEGPLRDSPGFGKVGEAMSGVAQLTGWADGPPLHAGFSHADSTTGLMGAFAVLAALHRRDVDPDFAGEYVDLALYETLFRLIEWQVVVFDQLGVVPTRRGNRMANSSAAIVNVFRSADGQWITVTSSTARSIQNIARLVGEDPDRYATLEEQLERHDVLDGLLADYIGGVSGQEALRRMTDADVVASKILTMADIITDETVCGRGGIVAVPDDDFGMLRMQGVVPKLANHPGAIRRPAPALGEHNEHVYRHLLGLGEDEYARLVGEHVI